jgi:hypothetical protein
MNKFPLILKALLDAGVMHHGTDWVGCDDDDQPVLGPDGEEGWFNSAVLSSAVEGFDAASVRAVVRFLWWIENIKFNKMQEEDYFKMISFIEQVQ